jgi:PAS domain S-box-containing protein
MSEVSNRQEPTSDGQSERRRAATLALEILRNMGDGLIATDLAGAIVAMNAAAERMTGVPLAEALGKPLSEVYRVEHERTPGSAPADPLAQVSEPGMDSSRPTDLLLISRDGTRRPIGDTINCVRTTSGTLQGAVVVFHDRSDMRELERRLWELQEEILGSAQRLADQNEELARANRAKTAFLALMSHELRTPLNAILGFAELLLDGNGGTPAALQASFVGNIHHSGKQLLRMINDLLDVSMIEQGEVELRISACSLARLASGAAAALESEARAQNVRLSAQLTGIPDVLVRADQARLSQAVHGVVARAIKVTPDKGEVTVTLGSGARPGCARLSVRDSGLVTHTQLARQLAPFGSLGNEKVVGGLDLGLALSKQLVELMGGGLEVEGNADHGTTLHLELPLWHAPAKP